MLSDARGGAPTTGGRRRPCWRVLRTRQFVVLANTLVASRDQMGVCLARTTATHRFLLSLAVWPPLGVAGAGSARPASGPRIGPRMPALRDQGSFSTRGSISISVWVTLLEGGKDTSGRLKRKVVFSAKVAGWTTLVHRTGWVQLVGYLQRSHDSLPVLM